jgi:hypothetical protein
LTRIVKLTHYAISTQLDEGSVFAGHALSRDTSNRPLADSQAAHRRPLNLPSVGRQICRVSERPACSIRWRSVRTG